MVAAAKRVTATGAATSKPALIAGVIVETSSAGGARLTITDGNGGQVLIDVSIAESDLTMPLYFPEPFIRFKEGVWVSTLTNINAITLITG